MKYILENNARLMVMVVSDTSTLYIYEQNTLLWSCQLTFMPAMVTRGFFPSLPGSLVFLTDYGEVKCCYLGTEPELFTAPPLPGTILQVLFD
jgi:Bardet-Biedl syndrome 9 protein